MTLPIQLTACSSYAHSTYLFCPGSLPFLVAVLLGFSTCSHPLDPRYPHIPCAASSSPCHAHCLAAACLWIAHCRPGPRPYLPWIAYLGLQTVMRCHYTPFCYPGSACHAVLDLDTCLYTGFGYAPSYLSPACLLFLGGSLACLCSVLLLYLLPVPASTVVLLPSCARPTPCFGFSMACHSCLVHLLWVCTAHLPYILPGCHGLHGHTLPYDYLAPPSVRLVLPSLCLMYTWHFCHCPTPPAAPATPTTTHSLLLDTLPPYQHVSRCTA